MDFDFFTNFMELFCLVPAELRRGYWDAHRDFWESEFIRQNEFEFAHLEEIADFVSYGGEY